MNVVRVRVVHYRLPFRAPYVTAAGVATHREGLIMQLETETGRVGLGEASLLPGRPVDWRYICEILDEAAPSLFRRDAGLAGKALLAAAFVRGFHLQDRHLQVIATGFSLAAYDLRAREMGVSLSRYLQDGAVGEVAVNALLAGSDVEAVRTGAAAAREAGYGTVKLKVGVAQGVGGEVERVTAVREAIGADLKLRLDANGAWSEAQAIETLRAMAPYDIEYVEQPVAAGQLETMRRVREAVPMPIAADEDATDAASVQRIIETEAADVIVLKPLQLANLALAFELAETAQEAGLAVVVTTSVDTGVGTAAALQLAAAVGGPYAHGLATLDLLEDDLILDPSLPVERGVMRLPDAIGLGVALDEAALTRYAVEEWQARA